jgi:CheY-like chemotaxis protein
MPKARILCVDDEPSIRTMVAHCVSDLGHTAVEAESGEAALDLLGNGRFDLLITDIRMGGISGWEVAEQARQDRPDLPIIY